MSSIVREIIVTPAYCRRHRIAPKMTNKPGVLRWVDYEKWTLKDGWNKEIRLDQRL